MTEIKRYKSPIRIRLRIDLKSGVKYSQAMISYFTFQTLRTNNVGDVKLFNNL